MDNVVGTAHIPDYARKQDNLDQFVYFSTMRFLVLHQKESISKKMIDIIQQIPTPLQRQVEKN